MFIQNKFLKKFTEEISFIQTEYFPNLTVEIFNDYGEKKIEFVISNPGQKMGSISLLPNGTIDSMVIEIDSEKIIFNETVRISMENIAQKIKEILGNMV